MQNTFVINKIDQPNIASSTLHHIPCSVFRPEATSSCLLQAVSHHAVSAPCLMCLGVRQPSRARWMLDAHVHPSLCTDNFCVKTLVLRSIECIVLSSRSINLSQLLAQQVVYLSEYSMCTWKNCISLWLVKCFINVNQVKLVEIPILIFCLLVRKLEISNKNCGFVYFS